MPNRVTYHVEVNRAVVQAEGVKTGTRRVVQISRAIEREAKARCPVRTGHTRSTIKAHTPTGGAGGVHATITAGGAAEYITHGTRPHIIRARKGSALSFRWHGRQVFFRQVHHPGTKPYPFMDIAAEVVAARYRSRR